MTRVSLLSAPPPAFLYPKDHPLTLSPAAFAFGAKKSGHNIDKNTSEKITDGARGLYEKATGKKVDPKISN